MERISEKLTSKSPPLLKISFILVEVIDDSKTDSRWDEETNTSVKRNLSISFYLRVSSERNSLQARILRDLSTLNASLHSPMCDIDEIDGMIKIIWKTSNQFYHSSNHSRN